MIELKHVTEFPREVIALDEVGRSPLSGPVVIGCVRLLVTDNEKFKSLIRLLRRKGIKDSKLLSAELRQSILKNLGIQMIPFRNRGEIELRGMTLSYVTWEMNHQIIDTENILQASLRGMKEASLFLSVGDKTQSTLLIDGHMKLKWDSEIKPWEEISIIKGDVKSALIGLASVIAKERRDQYMQEMHVLYPQYGFDTNMGYPTRFHRLAIAQFGPCPIHRLSFNKVKEFLTPGIVT